ncbi:MAG: RluA family pseudouridine synthase [Reichenbachiella sp.]
MNQESTLSNDYFKKLDGLDPDISPPSKFTYPFFYEPHPLCVLAVGKLQKYLETQNDWDHDFGIEHHVKGVNIGKMFGVLVVEDQKGELGYLQAFSGKLADQNHQKGFVPPVADILKIDSFFRRGEKEIEEITSEIHLIENSGEYLYEKGKLEQLKQQFDLEVQTQKNKNRTAKADRKNRRNSLSIHDDHTTIEAMLQNESKKDHFELKDLNRKWKIQLSHSNAKLDALQVEIDQLKIKRKKRSGDLQKEIFDQYQFLNIEGKTKSVQEIFEKTTFKIPPSGAGDCALPKLLQFAFLHQLKPLAMAEFWWGQSPSSEIRKHGFFYPSCKGKCEPILSHMLSGMEVDSSPLSLVSTIEKQIETIYEDDHLVVINKPHDFLSVPGKTNVDSVYQRMMDKYPDATGPMMVHRLDRATSGLMIVAKSKESHKSLQEQFRNKTIKKQYVALLEGNVNQDKGTIHLPIRADLEDRPRQLVCFEYGKPALTHWKVLERKDHRTRIQFFPVTGRTHQLRVHAAHIDGLNIPIVGDDLYGKSDSRLYLHAAFLAFNHPVSEKRMEFNIEPKF